MLTLAFALGLGFGLSSCLSGGACLGKPTAATVTPITGNDRGVRQYQLALDVTTIKLSRVVDRSRERLVDLALDQTILVRTDSGTYGYLFLQMADTGIQHVKTVTLTLVQAKRRIVKLVGLIVVKITDSLVVTEISVYL